MAENPKKNTTDYFPHLLKDSTTIRALEMLYGNDGYAVWFKLLEVLGVSPDYKYKADTTDKCNELLDRFKVEGELMAKIIDTLCELNAIDKTLWKQERILYVPNLLSNIQKMKRKINKTTNLAETPSKKTKKLDKKQYLEYVFLLDEEYAKLVDRFGEASTKERIETLDNYIGQKPSDKKRQYESHYRTILVWDSMDKKKNISQPKKTPQYKDLSNYKLD